MHAPQPLTIKEIGSINVAEDEELVSFEVSALHTSSPNDRALRVVNELLQEEESSCVASSLNSEQIVNLLELCLRSKYFSFRNEYYQHIDGVAMRSSVSSVVANIFRMVLQKKPLQSAVFLEPKLWRRYVDDVFSIIKRKNT